MLWREAEHETLLDEVWDERRARAAIREIVADAEQACVDGFWPMHEWDEVGERPLCGLYLGGAGMIWGLMRLESEIDARALAERMLGRYRDTPDFFDHPEETPQPPSLFLGETGLLMTAAKAGSPMADMTRLRTLVTQNAENPMRELLYGSAGTTLAARAAGLQDCWRYSAAWLFGEWDPASDLWTQSFDQQQAQYLGAAHGFAGNVHALRGYVESPVLAKRVERLLSSTALHEGDLVNWPPALQSPPEAIRVQWCHGAPGIVSLLGDLMPVDLALGGGELIWRAGPLRKGAGLCHGTAGNAFAFLRLFAVTGDEQWLDRARRFAMRAVDQVIAARERTGRGRYTLWTGDIGVALCLHACLEQNAAMPTIDDLSPPPAERVNPEVI